MIKFFKKPRKSIFVSLFSQIWAKTNFPKKGAPTVFADYQFFATSKSRKTWHIYFSRKAVKREREREG